MDFMEEAIKEAYEGIQNKDGGPFGAIIVKNNKIIGRGHNRVLKNEDPTCHGEMEAIRDACKNLGTHDLSGSVIYTTAEPCPMCLGAILWSNMTEMYYGCTKEDTDAIGFRDDAFYDHLAGKKQLINKQEYKREQCLKLFDDYKSDDSNNRY